MRAKALAVLFGLASMPALTGAFPSGKPILPRNEETYRAILEAAKDPNRDVRALVAWTIARIGRPDGLATLEALAMDATPEVRAAALRAMRMMLPPRSQVKVLLEVPVEDADLRREALAAARCLFFEQRSALLNEAALRGTLAERIQALEALELDLPHQRPPWLLEALKDPNAHVRAAAIRVISTGADHAQDLIKPFLADKSGPASFLVRASACEALAALKALSAAPELRRACADEHFLVRRAAIRSLASLADEEAIPSIQSCLTDYDYTVREAACTALGVLISPASPAMLVERLGDSAPEVRDAATASLEKFHPDVAYAAVLKYADDKGRPEVRRRCWGLLGLYAHPATREVAFNHLDDPDLEVQAQALRVLGALQDVRIVPRLNRILRFSAQEPAPPDPLGAEAFRAAMQLKLREPIPAAMFALRIAANPPMAPIPFAPSSDLVAWAIRYLVALDHKAAVPDMEKIFAMAQDDPQWGPELSGLLEKLTGKKYPITPPAPETGSFFLDVASDR